MSDKVPVLRADADAFFDGPDADNILEGGEDEGRVAAESLLWRAVIRQAFADLGVNFEDRRTDTRIKNDPLEIRKGIRLTQNAARALTSMADPWLDDRRFVCALAGYDEQVIRQAALRVMAEKRPEYKAEERRLEELQEQKRKRVLA